MSFFGGLLFSLTVFLILRLAYFGLLFCYAEKKRDEDENIKD